MPNSFYNHGSTPVFRSQGQSSFIRAEFDAVTEGFNKLPTLSAGVAYRLLAVNAAGDGIETVFSGYRGLGNDPLSTAFGTLTLSAASTNTQNTAFGYWAGKAITSGFNNVAVGFKALEVNTTGQSNIAIGAVALQANTGNNNIGIGDGVMYQKAAGNNNVGIGPAVMNDKTSGNYNTAVGSQVLYRNVSGGNNTAYGYQAAFNFTGSEIVAIGHEAGLTNVSGAGMTSVGYRALKLSTGDDNTAVGYLALSATTTGTGNTAVGTNALASHTSGFSSTAVGANALTLSTGTANTAVGQNAIPSITSGASNTAVGQAAGSQLTTTSASNTLMGQGCLPDLAGVSSNNTVLGAGAGANVSSGSQNTFVGSGAGASSLGAYTNTIAIGYTAVATKDNQMMLGNSSLVEIATVARILTGESVLAYETAYGDAGLGSVFTCVDTDGRGGHAQAKFSNSSSGSSYSFIKGRGTAAAGAIVQSGDELGTVIAYGVTGGGTATPAASITFGVDSTPGVGDMPGRIMFRVTPDGAAIPVEAMRISNTGITTLRIGTATAAGGVGMLVFGSTSGFGIYIGSGAPTISAAQGSLYLRSDGSGTTNRAYINTNGATTWTALTTVA